MAKLVLINSYYFSIMTDSGVNTGETGTDVGFLKWRFFSASIMIVIYECLRAEDLC